MMFFRILEFWEKSKLLFLFPAALIVFRTPASRSEPFCFFVLILVENSSFIVKYCSSSWHHFTVECWEKIKNKTWERLENNNNKIIIKKNKECSCPCSLVASHESSCFNVKNNFIDHIGICFHSQGRVCFWIIMHFKGNICQQ